MNKLVVIAISLSCFIQSEVYTQSNKQDYVWLFSSDPDTSIGFESVIMDFNQAAENILQPVQNVIPIQFSGSNASVCDSDGNLLFYTNGCQVVNKNHEVMPNGHELTRTQFTIDRGDTCIWMSGWQDIIILEDPAYEYGYYILHHSTHTSTLIRDLRYSYVDMLLDNGNGDVTEAKNIPLTDFNVFGSYLTAMRHANGKDWWVVQPTHDDEFLTFLIDEEGIHIIGGQTFDVVFDPINATLSGTARFSPDGKMYAYYNSLDDLLLFDFNRENGELSNLKIVDVIDPERWFWTSVEFSPNSEFLYVCAHDTLWQYEINGSIPKERLKVVGIWDGSFEPFATNFHLMALAPDCKIYMASSSSTKYYHVIHDPNKKGRACNFEQKAIQLDHFTALATMPNFPRWRVDEEYKCDALLTGTNDKIGQESHLDIFPNPVTKGEKLIIKSSRIIDRCLIFSASGALIATPAINAHTNQSYEVDISGVEEGLCFIKVEFKDGSQSVNKIIIN